MIGEGSGATAAWLAADLEPDHVIGVVAVEPAGPPFGTGCQLKENGERIYGDVVEYNPGTRPYGISDVPLGFDPPPNPDLSFSLDPDDTSNEHPLNVALVTAEGGHQSFLLQDPGASSSAGDDGNEPIRIFPRQLVNLKKMKHAVFTAHASCHSTYDRATCLFLEQAGVEVRHFTLASAGIFGNGHLMFLERNSDRLASMVHSCMKQGFPGLRPIRLGPAVTLPRYNGRRQSMIMGFSTNQSRLRTLTDGPVTGHQRLNPGQTQSGAKKTVRRDDRIPTGNPVTAASMSLAQASPPHAAPSRTPKQKLGFTAGILVPFNRSNKLVD